MSIIKINKIVVKMKMLLKLHFPSQLQKYLTLATETEEKIKKKRSKKDHNHLIVNQDLSQLLALKQPQMQKDKA
jgi:hypothetical protein